MEEFFFHPTRPPDGGLGPCASQPTHPSLSHRNRSSLSHPLLPSAPRMPWWRPGQHSELVVSLQRHGGGQLGGQSQVRQPPFFPVLALNAHAPLQSRRRCKIEARSLRAWRAEGWPSSTSEGEYDARGRFGAGPAMDYTGEVRTDVRSRVGVFGCTAKWVVGCSGRVECRFEGRMFASGPPRCTLWSMHPCIDTHIAPIWRPFSGRGSQQVSSPLGC